WRVLFGCRIQTKTNPAFQFMQEVVARPAVLEEKELEPRSFPALAQYLALTKKFCDAFEDGQHLLPPHKGIQANPKVRIGSVPSANAQREADLRAAAHGSQPDIVDLRIRAPNPAARDRYFELARQVVKISIARNEAICFQHQRRRIADLIRINTG